MDPLTTVLNQIKEATSNELDILSARLNRLRDTGSNDSLIKSVEATMKAKVAQYEKLEENSNSFGRGRSQWQLHGLMTQEEAARQALRVHQVRNQLCQKTKTKSYKRG